MRSLLPFLLLALWACQPAAVQPAPDPDAPTRSLPGQVAADHGMAVSAHPLASEVGVEILRAGGNAIDAAVATAFAVGVVEPMMAGIGGSGGMLIWDQAEGRADYLDFYARAPSTLEPDAAERRDDHPARLVAVPGTVAGLLAAHERFGVLPRERIMAPAIRLAEEGFPISGLLSRVIADDSVKLTLNEGSQELFWPGHRPLAAGERLVQTELAATMRRISQEGAAGFHEGVVAREVVDVLRADGNSITTGDLAGFKPVWRRPVCGSYRGRTVLSAPPPQSGMQIVQTLHLLEADDMARHGLPPFAGAAADALAGALRLATADRMRFMADPDHVAVPAAGITSPAYARERADLLAGSGTVPNRVEPGEPGRFDREAPAASCEQLDPFAPAAASGIAPISISPLPSAKEGEGSEGETTHISVTDGEGNAVSLTFTQGAYFGSGVWAAGTFLNNAMGIFSSDPESPNFLTARRAPASTTTPTIILENGRVRMVVGAAGGGRIPHAVVQAIVYTLDYGLTPLQALGMPRIHPHVTAPRIQFEQGYRGEVLESLRQRGYRLEAMPPGGLYFGGVQMIERRNGQWVGAADPRRDGEPRGH